jgi:hypothetical protein
MIVTSDIGDILYRDCKSLLGTFGIKELYQSPNTPIGEIITERIVIIPPKGNTPEKYWEKSFANINIVVPDKKGKEDMTRLQNLQRVARAKFNDRCGEFDGTGYTYGIASNGIEEDTDLKCHYVNIKILFNALNIKLCLQQE